MPLIESVSGIRGIYNKDLTDGVAFNYAKAYYSFLKNKIKNKTPKIVIGMDTRPSNSALKKSVINALDCEIIDLEIASTPLTQFAVRHHKSDGGIIITASHNEPEWNGFKFLQNNGSVLNENDANLVISNYKKNKKKIRGGVISKKIIGKSNEIGAIYSNFVLKTIEKNNNEKIKKQKIKIAIDPNGGTGFIAKNILEKTGVNVVAVNEKIGRFNRVVEPNEKSLSYLTEIIKKNNCEFAAGFDCDADRVEIILEDGTLVSGHHILALASYYYLKRHKENKNAKNNIIVVNDATSYAVRDVVEKLNGKIIETGVGEANVVEQMYKLNALLGGEGSSGGVIIPPSRCRDGILSLLAVLSLMAMENSNLDSLIKKLPQYYTTNKKISIEKDNFGLIKKNVMEHYSKKGCKITSQSGSVKVIASPDSFVCIRESKTEANIIRIIADSRDKILSAKLIEEAELILQKSCSD